MAVDGGGTAGLGGEDERLCFGQLDLGAAPEAYERSVELEGAAGAARVEHNGLAVSKAACEE